mgnify:CR=1 FL=1
MHNFINTKMNRFSSSISLSVVAVAASSLFAMPSLFAQDGSTGSRLEEILVTAQKRQEGLSEVPISISVLNKERLEDIGAVSFEQLSSSIPGFFVAKGVQETSIYMRGVGSGTNKGFDQSVAQFVDGMYVGKGYQYQMPLLDFERIEVLRGPQSVLFGKNTIGGVVNITTSSPNIGSEFEGMVSAEYVPDWNSRKTQLAATLPVSDTLALRVAAGRTETDGFVDNVYTRDTEPQVEMSAVRVSALWTPDDDTEVSLKVALGDTERRGQAGTVSNWDRLVTVPQWLASGGSPAALAAHNIATALAPELAKAGELEFTTYSDGTIVTNGNPPGVDVSNESVIFNYIRDLGAHTFTSTTTYSSYDTLEGADADFTPLHFTAVSQHQQFSQFSQEFVLASEVGERFEYLVGAYFDNQDHYHNNNVMLDLTFGQPSMLVAAGLPPTLSLAFTQGTFGANQIATHSFYDLKSNNWSIFSQGTLELSDSVSVTLGLRYSEDEKEVLATQVHSSDATGGIGAPNFTRHPAVLGIFNNLLGRVPYDFPLQTRSENNLTPALKIEWSASDSVNMYFSYVEGYKAGGFDGSDNAAQITNTQPGPAFEFEDEQADSLEMGAKFDIPDYSFRGSVAAFSTDYKNLQVSAFNGTSFEVSNAAAATIKGAEMEFQWAQSDNLLMGVTTALLDFEYDEFMAACTAVQIVANGMANPGSACVQNLAGYPGDYAPGFSGSVFVNYNFELSEEVTVLMGLDANHVDEYHTAGDSDPSQISPATTRINLRIGIEDSGGNWEVMLFGRNLTNEQSKVFGLDIPIIGAGTSFHYVEPGKEIGLRVTAKF